MTARRASASGHVFKLQGKDHEDDRFGIIAGDIGAVAKLDEIHHDSVLHTGDIGEQPASAHALVLPQADVRPGDRGHEQGRRVQDGRRAAQDDGRGPDARARACSGHRARPCSAASASSTCGSSFKLLKDRYGVEVDTKPPKVAYKETITSEVRRPPPPQEADGRGRTVRRGLPPRRAPRAKATLEGNGRRSLIFEDEHVRRLDAEAVHARDREGRAPACMHDGADRRLPAAEHQA